MQIKLDVYMCNMYVYIYTYDMLHMSKKRVLTLKSGILRKTVFSWDMQA